MEVTAVIKKLHRHLIKIWDLISKNAPWWPALKMHNRTITLCSSQLHHHPLLLVCPLHQCLFQCTSPFISARHKEKPWVQRNSKYVILHNLDLQGRMWMKETKSLDLGLTLPTRINPTYKTMCLWCSPYYIAKWHGVQLGHTYYAVDGTVTSVCC